MFCTMGNDRWVNNNRDSREEPVEERDGKKATGHFICSVRATEERTDIGGEPHQYRDVHL